MYLLQAAFSTCEYLDDRSPTEITISPKESEYRFLAHAAIAAYLSNPLNSVTAQ